MLIGERDDDGQIVVRCRIPVSKSHMREWIDNRVPIIRRNRRGVADRDGWNEIVVGEAGSLGVDFDMRGSPRALGVIQFDVEVRDLRRIVLLSRTVRRVEAKRPQDGIHVVLRAPYLKT